MTAKTEFFFITLFIFITLISGCSSEYTANPPERGKPNIVFILADDLGMAQLGCYGSSFYETPNIDTLANQGMRFTNAYAACTVCSPTRASIMTGKYPARLHLTDYIPGQAPKRKLLTPNWTKELLPEEITIAESLKKAGYRTGHFGKWHLNKNKKYKLGRPGDPGSQGFDDVLTTHKPRKGPKSPYPEDWHHVRQITERALQFLDNNRDNPFFCYVSYNSIHDPEIEKEELVRKYAVKPQSKLSNRYNPTQAAMLETMDNSVGSIVNKISELGLENDTIVVFFSDNGQKTVKEGKPFRGSKGDLYEGGIHMPLIVRWPGRTPAGSTCDEIVISHDFFPTFNEITGAADACSNDIDGESIAPLFNNPDAQLTRDAVYWHFPHYHSLGIAPQGAIRKGRYKLIEWFEESIYNESGAFELYDLENDPGEQNNLAGEMPEKVNELKQQLSSWRTEVGAQEMEKNN